jgi:hypothetical protein
VTFAAKLEQVGPLGDDLAVKCNDDVARRLTEAMWNRARELAADGRITATLPDTVGELGRVLEPRQVAQIIATVVATGLEYDPAFEAGAPSMLALTKRLFKAFGHPAIRAAEQATAARATRGVCLEFATATRVLFYALKRSTGAPAHAYVPAIYGAAINLASSFAQHAWNWLVDGESGSIAAFDAASRDARESDFTIDASRYRNVSAFLGSVCGSIRSSSECDDARDLLRATIEPETERGQVLLFHLADNLLTHVNVRQWISARLEACSFQRVVPDFRARLARRDEALGRLGRMVFTTGEWALRPFDDLRLERPAVGR